VMAALGLMSGTIRSDKCEGRNMARKKPISVRAKASAKFGAVAKATYERKKTTMEVIPPEVTRAKAGAWLDVISPITEWAGLKGDQLRHKRHVLRLQQEETLLKVGLEARRRLQQLGVTPEPIPTKALVPILEKASLESPDSDLIQAWGNLLASTAAQFDSEVMVFASILSEIGSRERAIIEEMVGASGLGVWEDRVRRATHGLTAEWLINQETIKPILRDAMENQDFGVFSALRRFVPTGYPCLITKIMRSQIIGTAVKPVAVFESPFYSQRSAGFEVLSHQGLIREGGTGFNFGPEEAPLSVGWWEFTELGYAFVARIVARDTSTATQTAIVP
jgi:hypothetical protein